MDDELVDELIDEWMVEWYRGVGRACVDLGAVVCLCRGRGCGARATLWAIGARMG